MTIIKPLLAMLIASIRKELTIQKPEVIAVKSRKEHKPGDAAKGIMILIIAPIIFVILAGVLI